MKTLAGFMVAVALLMGSYTYGYDAGRKVNADAPTCWAERNPMMPTEAETLCGDAWLAHTESFVRWVKVSPE